jgi:hypothetical protein
MSRHTFAVAALILFGLLSPLAAKRLPPPDVKPVTAAGVEYRAAHERYYEGAKPAGLRNFVEAREAKTGKVLWRVTVYEIKYQAGLETDVQDVYITALELDAAGGLLVRTEGKDRYRIDLGKRTATLVRSGK